MIVKTLTPVAVFKGVQITGVTISHSGRLFANFPRWRDNLPFSVVEVMPNGDFKPYPDVSWNSWTGEPQAQAFTCVQSVVAQGDSLFVLDPASPKMQGVVGNARLFEFSLITDTLVNVWTFDKTIAPEKSYLNDMRIDRQAGKVYITESGLGAIIVLDLYTNKARRLLDHHFSVKSEDIWLTVEGAHWVRNDEKPQIHADGIALSNDNAYLYYHALTGYGLYRVPTRALNDESLEEKDLAHQVESLGNTCAPDGMIFDRYGNLYLGDLERNSIKYLTPEGALKVLAHDPLIKWPDTFTIDQQDNLYFTTSRIHEATGDISEMEFHIFRVPIAAS